MSSANWDSCAITIEINTVMRKAVVLMISLVEHIPWHRDFALLLMLQASTSSLAVQVHCCIIHVWIRYLQTVTETKSLMLNQFCITESKAEQTRCWQITASAGIWISVSCSTLVGSGWDTAGGASGAKPKGSIVSCKWMAGINENGTLGSDSGPVGKSPRRVKAAWRANLLSMPSLHKVW